MPLYKVKKAFWKNGMKKVGDRIELTEQEAKGLASYVEKVAKVEVKKDILDDAQKLEEKAEQVKDEVEKLVDTTKKKKNGKKFKKKEE